MMPQVNSDIAEKFNGGSYFDRHCDNITLHSYRAPDLSDVIYILLWKQKISFDPGKRWFPTTIHAVQHKVA